MSSSKRSGQADSALGRVQARRDMMRQVESGESLDFIPRYESLEWLQDYWIDRGDSISNLVRRTRHDLFMNDLLERLAHRYRQTEQWLEFVDAVVTCQDDWFVDLLNPQTLRLIFNRGDTLTHIVKQHLELIRQQHHWIRALNWDTYWADRVRQPLEEQRHYRAFNELQKARNGFFLGDVADRTPAERDGISIVDINKDPANHAFAISKRLLAQLAEELYASMVAAGELPDQPLPNTWGGAPHRSAGRWLADWFYLGWSASDGYSHRFDPEGIMLLSIAEKFSREGRRQHRKQLTPTPSST